MLQLLGLSDQQLQEQMAKGHSYAFNMGNNTIIPFQDFHEAAEILMERNMPEVLHKRQTEAVFMPETHLPNMPMVVDQQWYQARKGQLDIGDLVEKEVSDELHAFYKNRKVVVLWVQG